MNDKLEAFNIDELLTKVIERTLQAKLTDKEISQSQYDNFSYIDDCLEVMIDRMENYIDFALDELVITNETKG